MLLVTPQVSIEPLASELLGASIDLPESGVRSSARSLSVAGWVVGRQAAVKAVLISSTEGMTRRILLSSERPDVDAYLEGAPGALRSGFSTTLDVSAMRSDELCISGVLLGGRTVSIGTIRLRRSWRTGTHPSERGVVSVVITSYNQGHVLGEAIESCLAQSYPGIEVVVVDDGSTDNTQEVARRYPTVRLVRQENAGLSAARNTGIRRTNGEYLMFVDADHRLVPDGVRLNVATLSAAEECAFVSGEHRYIDLDGKRTEEWVRPAVQKEHYQAFLRTNYIGCPAAVTFRRGVFQAIGGFDDELSACEDYDIYLRIARRFPVLSHSGLVAEYRRHDNSMSRDSAMMLSQATRVLRRQRAFVRGRPGERAALREGLRAWQRRYAPDAKVRSLSFDNLTMQSRPAAGAGALVDVLRRARRHLSRVLPDRARIL